MSNIKKRKYPSILETVHEAAKGLYKAKIIKVTTMRKFDEMCLPKVENLSPSQIKSIRLREKVSQPIFAKFLNTSESTIKQWEQGGKHPRGISLKMLNLVSEKGLNVLLPNEQKSKKSITATR